ncbi:MAG: DedA family protein [Planctomycetaceae bacterium]|nr:DedA family protein [Planctomycetaceae bacterium]
MSKMEDDRESRPGLLRRLYNWVLSWANTPYGSPALFVLAFLESSFFPIPPDVLQIALSAEKPKRSFWYAGVSLVGSVLGALFGYLIGYMFWEATQSFFYAHLFREEDFARVKDMYQTHDFWAVYIGAFTPIPYKIFTIAAGVCHIAIPMFIVASIIGRGMRFFAVAALMFFFGPTIKCWIEKYFNLLAIVFTVLLIGGFILLKYVL